MILKKFWILHRITGLKQKTKSGPDNNTRNGN